MLFVDHGFENFLIDLRSEALLRRHEDGRAEGQDRQTSENIYRLFEIFRVVTWVSIIIISLTSTFFQD